jgi:TatD DNase family protein
MGLDKHKGAALPRQIEILELQLGLARKLNLPVVLHQVGAQREFFEVLERAGPLPQGGVLHGFGGDIAWAKALMKKGLHIGIGGGILHAPRERLRKAVSQLPLERLVVETDAPDGRLSSSAGGNSMRSEPGDIHLVVTKLSELLGASEELVARCTYENASSLYGF